MNIIKLIGKYWVKIDMYVVVVVLWMFVISPMQKDLTRMAAQPKYSIQNDITKPKVRKGGSIDISPNNVIAVNDTTIKKKGLFKRIFKNKR